MKEQRSWSEKILDEQNIRQIINLDVLERKYQMLARKEAEACQRAGFVLTTKWLDALERKYQALALREIAFRTLLEIDAPKPLINGESQLKWSISFCESNECE